MTDDRKNTILKSLRRAPDAVSEIDTTRLKDPARKIGLDLDNESSGHIKPVTGRIPRD